MKKLGVFFGLILIVCVMGTANAASFDPHRNWKTIKTEHFFIRYAEEIESVAQDTARILEEVHAKMSPKLEWKPWKRTEVILSDATDDSNGLTSVIPYNWMILYVVPARPDSSLANYDDWLRTLIVHEYTHLLDLDACRGVCKALRMIFGKTTAPGGLKPGWAREGFAVYEESKETTAGRDRASYTDMLVRTAVLEDDFPKIDEADGLQWKWPSTNVEYLFGGKFVQYLVDTYGEDKFLEFNKRVQGSLLLFMVNHQARNVYHKTFYQLWRDWLADLREKYGEIESKLEAERLTQTTDIIVPKWDEQFSKAVPSPDSKYLAYIATSPHRSTEIRIKNMETGKVEKKIKQEANKISWSPDGKKIVYSAAGSYKRYNYYFDVWMYDLETKKKKRLTKGERARDPAFDPSGKEIVYISGFAGTDIIKRMNLETKETIQVTDGLPKYIHFANPKFSPDGLTVAADTWQKGEGWKIYLYSLNGGWKKRLTKGTGLETSPWWSQDGKHVYYSSDETGISNIYRADVGSAKSEKLTNTLTGVFDPATSDGEKIFVREYHSKGFVISSFNTLRPVGEEGKKQKGKEKRGKEKTEMTAPSLSGTVAEGETGSDYPSQKYSPFGQSLFLPRYLMPGAVYLEDAFLFSLETGGSDALHYHNWRAGGTYRTDANFFGYYGGYFYNRWRPVMGVGVNDYAVDFGNLTFIDVATSQTRTVHYFEKRRNANAFLFVPVKKHNFHFSYFYEDRNPITKLTQPERDALNLGIFAGFVGNYIYGDAERFPASISPENGRLIRLSGMVTNSVFGSAQRNEQTIFSGDWREYIRLWHHHVLGLRAAGGMTWGDRLVQGTFGLGGAIGEGALAGGMSFNYFPLRGLPVSALTGTRAMLLSSEYRLPLVSPQRGIGTWPFFLNNLYAAFFADYGNAWNAHEGGEGGFIDFFSDFLLGVGTELRGDFVLGHGLPITGRLGYGIIVVNRDRLGNLKDPLLKTSLKYGTFILQLGTSF